MNFPFISFTRISSDQRSPVPTSTVEAHLGLPMTVIDGNIRSWDLKQLFYLLPVQCQQIIPFEATSTMTRNHRHARHEPWTGWIEEKDSRGSNRSAGG